MPGALLGWGLSSAAQTTHQALLCAEYSVYILPMQSPGRHGNLARLDHPGLGHWAWADRVYSVGGCRWTGYGGWLPGETPRVSWTISDCLHPDAAGQGLTLRNPGGVKADPDTSILRLLLHVSLPLPWFLFLVTWERAPQSDEVVNWTWGEG